MNTTERFSLRGKYALVIGGTSGIGKAIARGYLESGARVIIAGRNADKLAGALAELQGLGEVFGYTADVSEEAGLRGLVGITLAHHGRIGPASGQRDQCQRVVGLDHVGAGPHPVL